MKRDENTDRARRKPVDRTRENARMPRENAYDRPRNNAQRPSRPVRQVRAQYKDLFTRPNLFVQSALNAIGLAIKEGLQLQNLQKKALKKDICDLSALLTSERTELTTPYWTIPALTNAYIHYFMPWNLVRLCQLFPSLDLPEVEDEDYVLDMGSGPLTCIIALWIARPDYRNKKLNIIATDVSTKPMEIARDILEKLAELLEVPLHWNIRLHKQSYSQALAKKSTKLPQKAKLILSGNILNEVETRQKLQESELQELFSKYSLSVLDLLDERGSYIAIEPGTRQGGRLVSLLRQESIKNSLFPHAPCTHSKRCPFHERKNARSWCHMQCPAFAPHWLKDISAISGFKRESLALSFVQLKPYEIDYPYTTARLVSNPIQVPELGSSHYICTATGLMLLASTYDANLPLSAMISFEKSDKFDKKSRSPIVYLED